MVFDNAHRIDARQGFLLANAKAIELEEALGTDHTATGITISNKTAGENLAFPNLCFFKSDDKFWKTDADAKATTEGELAFALESITAESTGLFLKLGYLRDNSWSFTIGDIIYVDVNSGVITATKPSAVGDCVRRVGYAHATNIVFFNPSLTLIEL